MPSSSDNNSSAVSRCRRPFRLSEAALTPGTSRDFLVHAGFPEGWMPEHLAVNGKPMLSTEDQSMPFDRTWSASRKLAHRCAPTSARSLRPEREELLFILFMT